MKPSKHIESLDNKELDTVVNDMRTLYDNFLNGAVKREDADTAANIAGKNLKAQQLKLANAIFADQLQNGAAKAAFTARTAKALTDNS